MSVTKLIVGLGNPGVEYQQTRHNFGFLALEAWAKSHQLSFLFVKKFNAEICNFSISAQNIFCIRPQSFMNKSGESVQKLANFYQILPQNILVCHDELDIPFQKIKLANGGRSAGHNGIKSVSLLLGTENYHRLKLGIGRPVLPSISASDYVLHKFAKDEQFYVTKVCQVALQAIDCWLAEGLDRAMNQFNKK